jgi:hypothetical protein
VELFSVDNVDGVLQAGSDVFRGEVRIVIADDLREGDVVADQLKDCLYGNPGAGNTGLTEVDIVANYDTRLHGIPED